MDAFYHFEDSKSRVEVPTGAHKLGSVTEYDSDIFMWVKDPNNNASTVFHELVHVIHSLCDLKGIEVIDREFEAYLMGWLKIEVSDKIFFPEEELTKPEDDYHDSSE